MSCTGLDLTIEGALADPVIAAAMRADRIDPRGFEDLLRTTARHLDRERRPAAPMLAVLAGKLCRDLAGRSTPSW